MSKFIILFLSLCILIIGIDAQFESALQTTLQQKLDAQKQIDAVDKSFNAQAFLDSLSKIRESATVIPENVTLIIPPNEVLTIRKPILNLVWKDVTTEQSLRQLLHSILEKLENLDQLIEAQEKRVKIAQDEGKMLLAIRNKMEQQVFPLIDKEKRDKVAKIFDILQELSRNTLDIYTRVLEELKTQKDGLLKTYLDAQMKYNEDKDGRFTRLREAAAVNNGDGSSVANDSNNNGNLGKGNNGNNGNGNGAGGNGNGSGDGSNGGSGNNGNGGNNGSGNNRNGRNSDGNGKGDNRGNGSSGNGGSGGNPFISNDLQICESKLKLEMTESLKKESELRTVQDSLTIKTRQVRELGIAIAELNQKVSSLAKASKEKTDLEKIVQFKESQLLQLQEQLKSMTNNPNAPAILGQTDQLRASMTAIQAELNVLKDKEADLLNQVKSKEAAVSQQQALNQKLQDEFDKLRDSYQSALENIKRQTADIQQKDESLSIAHKKIADAEKKIEADEIEKQKLNAKLTSEIAELQSKTIKLIEVRSHAELLRDKLTNERIQDAELRKMMNQTSAQLANANKEVDELTKMLKQEREAAVEARSQLHQLQAKVNQLLVDKTTLEKKNYELTVTNKAQEVRLTEVTSERNHLRVKKERAENDLKERINSEEKMLFEQRKRIREEFQKDEDGIRQRCTNEKTELHKMHDREVKDLLTRFEREKKTLVSQMLTKEQQEEKTLTRQLLKQNEEDKKKFADSLNAEVEREKKAINEEMIRVKHERDACTSDILKIKGKLDQISHELSATKKEVAVCVKNNNEFATKFGGIKPNGKKKVKKAKKSKSKFRL